MKMCSGIDAEPRGVLTNICGLYEFVCETPAGGFLAMTPASFQVSETKFGGEWIGEISGSFHKNMLRSSSLPFVRLEFEHYRL